MGADKFLRSLGIKITQARIEIFNILKASNSPIDAEEIFHICKEKKIEINFSTVYRTLDLLECKGIVDKFDLGSGKYCYVIKKEDHKHLLQCKLCHKEIEIECPMQQVEELIKNKTGFSSIEHELKIEGICEECKLNKIKNI